MFKKMKMKTKIILGFGVVLVLLVVLGAVSIIVLNTAAGGFREYRELATDSNLASRLEINELMVQMNVKDFLIRGSEKEVEGYNQYHEKLIGYVGDAQEKIQDPERAELVDKVDDGTDQYDKAFKEVIRKQQVRDNLIYNTLNVKGPFIERTLTKILTSARNDDDMIAAYYASLAMRNLLLARLYVTKFLDTNEQSSVDRVKEEFAAFKEQTTILDQELQNPQRRAWLEDVRREQQVYEKSFNELVTTIKDRNTSVEKTLDVIGPEIAENADQIMLSVKDDQDELGPKLQASNDFAVLFIIIVGIAALILGILFAWVTSNSILKQLGEDPAVIQDITEKISKGDLSMEINEDRKKLMGVFLSMKNMLESLKYKAQIVDSFSEGNFAVDVEKASKEDDLGEALVVMRRSLNELLSQVNQAVDQVTAGADQISEASQNLSQGATEQASSVEEISSSLNEISSQAKQNAENATEATGLAKQAVEDANQGNQLMDQLVASMNKINNSSDEIKKIVKVIDDIAFQINLLALNANVEAARAGKYGKGFAVVADEVRNLAVRSADAVKDTTQMVEESISNIEEGNNSAQATSKQLDEIVSGSSKVADFLEEIALASKEQAQGIEQINDGIEQIDQVTQSNTASAEETASASEELASQAQQLQSMIARFQLDQSYVQSSSSSGGTKTSTEHLKRLGATQSQQQAQKSHPTYKQSSQKKHYTQSEKTKQQKSSDSTGIKLAENTDPKEVIKLDDDNFESF